MVEESKVLFLHHNPHRRLFQQWSYKVCDALYSVAHGDNPNIHCRHGLLKVIAAGQKVQGLEDENTESLVCMVLSALQELETSKVCSCFSALPWEFISFMISNRTDTSPSVFQSLGNSSSLRILC